MQLVIISLLSFLSIESAHAYLDPGTGSMIIQAVIGAVAGALFFIKTYWANIKAFFANRKKK